MVTETKLDNSFQTAQFVIDGYKEPFRLDRNKNGGGVAIYVRDDIPCEQLHKHTFPSERYEFDNSKGPIEGIFLEINLRKTKWLLFGTYHRPKQNDLYFFDCVSNALDSYLMTYDKFILAGDFNVQEDEQVIAEFLDKYNANNLVKNKTCFKSIKNPSYVDLIITNNCKSFQNTTVVSTGCSDFHKMALTILKSKFIKAKPRVIYYRDYTYIKNDQNCFKETLHRELPN